MWLVRSAALAALAATLLALGAAGTCVAASLPDGRGYELVSPPLKNGGEVMSDSQRTRAAANGSAIGFTALNGFADVASMGVATDYVSVRTAEPGTNGWRTHAIAPPQTAMPFVADTHFMEPAYWGEFSDDLTHGVFRSFSPVTDAPDVANEQNLYLRDDLLTPGRGSYRLLTDCPGCGAPFPPVDDPLLLDEQSFLAAASQDFGHVIFESRLPLTSDSTADPDVPTWNLFEWDHGVVRLAGVLPDTACGSPPCPAPQSLAGRGAIHGVYTPHTISADGSRIFFTVPAASCLSGTADCGDLYLRSNHSSTVQLNASEKTNGAGPGGTDPGGPQPAQYWDASSDGSRAFFISTEALTDDAPVNGDHKLYMYSVAPDQQGRHLTFVSVDNQPLDGIANDDVIGVMGASDDGHTVYFVDSGGQLVAGGRTLIPGVGHKVFRWHDGAIDYVGGTMVADQLPNFRDSYVPTPKQSRVSPDGRFLLFTASRGTALTGYNHGSCPNNGTDTQSCRELYLYRADVEPHLVCVSCNPSGAKATADASDTAKAAGAATVTYHLNHALSDDGRRVFFSTREALVPQDTNGKVDAYEYDASSGTVSLLSSGKDPSDSYFMDASRNGDDAFILTRERLVGWDVDGGYDLYDARVGGGFPEPPAGAVCTTAESCRGTVHAPLDDVAPASATANGANVRAHSPRKRTCRRGHVRKRVHGHVRCVRRARHHRGHRRQRRSGR